MPPQLQLHRGQFLLTSEISPPVPDFVSRPALGRTLHHSPDVPIQEVQDAQGQSWILLGRPVESDGPLDPAAQIAQTHTAEVPGRYAAWTGRWLLIGDDRVHTDAACMFGVYYDGTRVSSSPALLCPEALPEVELDQADTVNWFPPPLSGFPAVRHLLASQVLRVSSGTPEHRPLLVPLPDMPYEEVLDRLQALLLRTVSQAWGQRNLLALTAGYDSRLLLATAAHLQLPMTTFTQEHPSSISRADVALPPQLARIAGYEHELIRRPRRRRHDWAEQYDRQVAGHAREQDRDWLAYGQFNFLRPGDLLVRGTAFELGRTFYWHRLPPQPSLDALNSALSTDEYRGGGLQAWFEWAQAHPEDLDWRDRLYWEQRVGGWAAGCDLAMDLLPGERLMPSNSQLFLSLLLRVPVEYRRSSQHHIDLIRRLKPELLSLPINPKESRYSPRRLYAALYRRLPLKAKKLLFP